ncbi:cytochrome P450 6a2-like [Ischnura elegans]|uniref:cytochrome P450 6a2-like n=1 Tax=Ischnura elegans TaxID=197161 RepID=UPI001ED8B433|nr:cytochrome P450 6a2-like [Ischnura elegans]
MELMDFLRWDWPLFVALAAVAVAAFFIHYKIHYSYWKRRGFPELPSRPLPYFGHVSSLLLGKRSFTDVFNDLYKLAGDQPLVGYYHGTLPAVIVKDPEILRHVFVKDFPSFVDRGFGLDEEIDPLNAKGLFNLKGQRWKEMRARLSPTFTSGRMKAMFPIMHACAQQLTRSLAQNIEKSGGEAIAEAKEYMACFSIDVIATCAFGIECDALENPETSKFRRMGKLVFEPTLKRRIGLMLFLISPRILKWTGMKFTDEETSSFFSNFVRDMIAQREKAIEESEKNGGTTKTYGDFIHHLAMMKRRGLYTKDEKDEEEQDGDDHLEVTKTKEEPPWATIDNVDLTAQVMLFFSAGFETTSSSISFALFELSAYERGRKIQERLREEIDRVMEEDGGELTYSGLQRMHLLDRVIKEALRMYPPAGVLGRKAGQAYKFPGTDLVIDEGTQLFIPVTAMQQDKKFFPNPELFDPDRFLPENKENIQHFTYLPFGDGPRLCIGERFALMQLRLGLASLISKFELELCRDKTEVPLKFKKDAFVPTSEKGIWLKVTHRKGKK